MKTMKLIVPKLLVGKLVELREEIGTLVGSAPEGGQRKIAWAVRQALVANTVWSKVTIQLGDGYLDADWLDGDTHFVTHAKRRRLDTILPPGLPLAISEGSIRDMENLFGASTHYDTNDKLLRFCRSGDIAIATFSMANQEFDLMGQS